MAEWNYIPKRRIKNIKSYCKSSLSVFLLVWGWNKNQTFLQILNKYFKSNSVRTSAHVKTVLMKRKPWCKREKGNVWFVCVWFVGIITFSLDCLQETDSVVDFVRDFAEDLFQSTSSFIQVLELPLRSVNHVLCTQRTHPQETLSHHSNNRWLASNNLSLKCDAQRNLTTFNGQSWSTTIWESAMHSIEQSTETSILSCQVR